MAIDLTVSLSDQEQALIEQTAALVAPGTTPAQIKAWAEALCKEALREASRTKTFYHYLDEALLQWDTDWPSTNP